jgi:hypothetical protein
VRRLFDKAAFAVAASRDASDSVTGRCAGTAVMTE